MDNLFKSVLVLGLAVPSLCQIHLGPQGTLPPPLACYNCDGHGHNTFPNCLNHVHNCHDGEVCAFTYGHGDPKIHCQRSQDCQRETSNPMRNCTGGGVEVHLNECKKCCNDAQCSNDLTELLKLEFMQSPHMMCPGWCMEDDVQSCIDRSKNCTNGQFCQVVKEEGEIWGECKDDHEWHHCNDELNRHPCSGSIAHGPNSHPHSHEVHGKCYWDCCDTLDCLNNHFGSYADNWKTTDASTTPPPTTMPPMPTTPPPTTMPPMPTTLPSEDNVE